ncbi:Bacterial Ig-like group 2 [Arabidopsis thaliana x Arabidopsis arenosa]|uniref:Bacterial Ig-like group 2 n=1 Tax=Arabidopsis thaliana x Arabidopsis arenosa TaxID=1240361 RepID=A0A8T1YDP6_9BRAS|nr:Bacterial Ig-like group 2 [Arabidopsis thaliana x Arabidopsis arenosa]
MVRVSFCFFFLLLLLSAGEISSQLGSGPHITDVNILLPPKMKNPVEYRLQGSDGCFKWSWDHHDILSVTPEFNSSSHCSTSARLRSISPYSGRKETAVYATDIQTGMVIRCKVFIDNFSRIQIFHNSIKLDLDGLSMLRVRAFDNEENEFSSLVGLQFMWKLMPESGGSTHHLAHVPLKESPLTDCGGLCGYLDIQKKLEDSGVFADLFVVKGTKIGHEKVSVHLLEAPLTHIADDIVLTVAEAMSLEPRSPVYVLMGASFGYTLKVMRGNVPQAVHLPSPHHRWSVLNTSVAQVDSLIGLTKALSLGVTTVVVEDTRVAGHIQGSSINVVTPDTIILYISPWSMSGDLITESKPFPSSMHWYVVSGRQYLIQMKIFSGRPDAHEIYITETDDIKLYGKDSDYWKIFSLPDELSSEYGQQNSRILNAMSPGLGELTATLTYFSGHQESKEVLKVVQEIMVCEKVQFTLNSKDDTPKILLPWTPAVYQEMELIVTGGCAKASSDYKWFTSDMSILSVSAYGIIQAKRPGIATVKVVSTFDSQNFDEVIVEVSIPSSMVMLQNFPVETVVGSHLKAAVTMKALNGALFSRCDAFNSLIKWKTGSDSFVIVNATSEIMMLDELRTMDSSPPCSRASILTSSPGRTVLQATLAKEFHYFDKSLSESIDLKATLSIGAYLPLSVRQDSDGNHHGGYWFDKAQEETDFGVSKLYLVPGTYVDVMLLGGPERWDDNVEFTETVKTLNEDEEDLTSRVNVHHEFDRHANMYRISCQKLGSYKLVFLRGNLVGMDHPVPAVAEALLSVHCSFPSSVVLIVDEPVNKLDVIRAASQADRAPGRLRVTPVTVANGQIIRVAAVGISEFGEAFSNSSTLSLRWELTSCNNLAHWDDNYNSKMTKSSWERFLALRNESGLCTVRATVSGIDYSYSTPLPQGSQSTLTDAVRLQLVSTLRVTPEFNLVFFNPNAKVNLSMTGGSCLWEAVVNNSRVAEVIRPPSGLQCSQMMLSPKGLGTTLVTVYDIGVSPPLSALALIKVADVDWIKIASGDEISIMEGSTHSIDLLTGIDDGMTFDSSQYPLMDIMVHIEDDLVEHVTVDDNSLSVGEHVGTSSFKIAARRLGITTLYVSARQQSGDKILSQTIKVEVYSPPRLHPQGIFLVPGASYVLTIEGGPTMNVSVDYTTVDNEVAKIEKSGRLYATSPGNTTIYATIYGSEGTVVCQAIGNAEVGLPAAAMLVAQSDTMAVGHEMPMSPSFPEGDLLSFYELCSAYKWTIEDEKVLIFIASSINVEENAGFVNVVQGRSAGKTGVTIAFSCDFVSPGLYSESRTYEASMILSVVPDLPLSLGAPMTWVLPPFYTSSGLLPSSLEPQKHRDGQSHRGNIVYSILKDCSSRADFERDTISINGGSVKTTDSNNVACIQAKDRTSGRIEIAACVRVAEVAQIRMKSEGIPFHVIDLAVGGELELPINYYDTLGIPFLEAHGVITYNVETNHRDVVSIKTVNDQPSAYIKGIKHGKALIRVSIGGNLRKSDYVLVSVGAHIFPQNPVIHTGNVLNFSIAGSDHEVSGQWVTSNRSVLSVNVASGQAKAISQGSTHITFEGHGLKLQTKVTVLFGNTIYVDSPSETLANVHVPAEGYKFPVKFRENKFAVSENGNKATFNCQVDPPFIGYAKPWMDLVTGNTYCLFFPYSPEHLVRSMSITKDMKPHVSFSVNASLKEARHVSGSASALLIGGFSVTGPNKLNINPDSNTTIISIVGNTDVQIHCRNKGRLSINLIKREDFGIAGLALYKVNVLRSEQFTDIIHITLPATGQSVEIDVSYDTGESLVASSKDGYSVLFKILWCVLVLAISVIILMKVIDRQGPIGPTGATRTATNSGTAAPGTPERRSGAVIYHEESPRTPSPFMEYVKRTVDETPYYRREGRRRFNPQNTM